MMMEGTLKPFSYISYYGDVQSKDIFEHRKKQTNKRRVNRREELTKEKKIFTTVADSLMWNGLQNYKES
jgi:hypothetical protein